MNGTMYRLATGAMLLALALQVMTPVGLGMAHHEVSVEPIVGGEVPPCEIPPCETLLWQEDQVKGDPPAADRGGEVEPLGTLRIIAGVYRPYYYDGHVWGRAETEGNLLPLFTQIATTAILERWDGTQWVEKARDTHTRVGAWGTATVRAGAAFRLCCLGGPCRWGWWCIQPECPRIGALWRVRSYHRSTHHDGAVSTTKRSPHTHVDPPGPAPPPGFVALDCCCN